MAMVITAVFSVYSNDTCSLNNTVNAAVIKAVTKPTIIPTWVAILARYREPSAGRSAFELAITLGPFVALWALAWWSMSVSYWLTFAISLVNAAFLLRLFAIQHDCGHGAFFDNRTVSDWVGRVIGVLTLTPYDVWRRSHSLHHSHSFDVKRASIEKSNAVPNWVLLIFMAQMFIVYFYAGIAKIHPHWWEARALQLWFNYKSDYWLIGPVLAHPLTPQFFSKAGLFFDLLVAPAQN